MTGSFSRNGFVIWTPSGVRIRSIVLQMTGMRSCLYLILRHFVQVRLVSMRLCFVGQVRIIGSARRLH